MSIDDLLLDQLVATPPGPEAESMLLAALQGPAALEAALDGVAPAAPRPAALGAEAEPIGTYLTEIEVTGFRGIGPTATLPLVPGPGLTIVMGRNGSGKSTFAEAAEVALTGRLERLASRTSVWREDWRNLHTDAEPTIRIRLGVEGQPRGATVECHWPSGASLDSATRFLQLHGKPRQPVSALGWEPALVPYRPFLSYGELGDLIHARPSEVYDKLQSILGLGRLSEIDVMLTSARKTMKGVQATSAAAKARLQATLAESEDERARRAEALLAKRSVDLDALAELSVADAPLDDLTVPRLRQLASIELPDREIASTAAERLAAALGVIDTLAGTAVHEARALADLLSRALTHYESHAGAPCPVCGGAALDAAWATAARARRDELTAQAKELDEAHRTVDHAVQELRRALPTVPAVLGEQTGLDTAALQHAWAQWDRLVSTEESRSVAEAAVRSFDALAAALEPVRAAARDQLDARARVWQPVATQIAAWIDAERRALRAATALRGLTAAIEWLSNASDRIRNAALAPIAEQSNRIWETLRQGSNVTITAMRLQGVHTRRSLDIRLTVDETQAALGVMSQGELHSLGIALFLPRATLPASPFRFVVIDDPVQAMDPNKVYGLAQVLAEVAQTRQVIVFTHDDRLPAAVRHLQLPNARIHEVIRGPRSAVTVSAPTDGDPAARHLSSARAIAKDDGIDVSLRRTLVAIQVRGAIESASHDRIRRREHRAGRPAHEIEQMITQAVSARAVVALALVGDPSKHDEARRALDRIDRNANRVVTEVNRNAHGDGFGDPAEFVRHAEVLVRGLARDAA